MRKISSEKLLQNFLEKCLTFDTKGAIIAYGLKKTRCVRWVISMPF